MQGTRVRSLVREGATCRPVKPVCHHHRALRVLAPVLCTQRSHRSEKPAHRDVGAQRAQAQRSPRAAVRAQRSPGK